MRVPCALTPALLIMTIQTIGHDATIKFVTESNWFGLGQKLPNLAVVDATTVKRLPKFLGLH